MLRDINTFAQNISNDLYECVGRSRSTINNGEGSRSSSSSLPSRWDRLLQDKDDRRVWQAINWKAVLNVDIYTDVKPSDNEFHAYYNELMNVPTSDLFSECRNVAVTIPVLDDPISLPEVTAQVNKTKEDKVCGPDCIAPGVFLNHYRYSG